MLRAEDIHFMVDRSWRDVAVTFGHAHGPFVLDNFMPYIGSMRSTTYCAQGIFTERPEGLQDSYDIPVVQVRTMSETSLRVIGALKHLTLAGSPTQAADWPEMGAARPMHVSPATGG